jgi:beta-xylosidase
VNALRIVADNGTPISDAAVEIYEYVDYSANEMAAVVVDETETDSDGKWKDTLTLEDGRTWIVRIEKTGIFGPKILEITT